MALFCEQQGGGRKKPVSLRRALERWPSPRRIHAVSCAPTVADKRDRPESGLFLDEHGSCKCKPSGAAPDRHAAPSGENACNCCRASRGATPTSAPRRALGELRRIAAAGGGLNGCKEVMMEHIPGSYNQRLLQREIHSAGFMNKYEFLHLPICVGEGGKANGKAERFALLRFVTPDVAQCFYRCFHGARLRGGLASSQQAIEVLPVDPSALEQAALLHAMMATLMPPHHLGGSKPVCRTLPVLDKSPPEGLPSCGNTAECTSFTL